MDRPFVYINMAMTVDGKITSAAREYPEFASRVDRKNMDRLRAEADALLLGAGTLRADDPPLHVRDAEALEHRRSLGKPDGLLNVVVTASGKLDLSARCFTDGKARRNIVVTVEQAPEERLERLGGVAEVWKVGRARVDLPGLLRRLKGIGVDRLLVEGGGELNWEFIKDDLVDEIFVTIAPAVLGGRTAPTLLEGDGFPMKEQRRLKLVELRREGDELFCRYAVRGR